MPRTVLVLLLLTSACSVREDHFVYEGTYVDPAVPEVFELQERVRQLHEAWTSRSYRQWYLLATPEFRASTPYYDFVDDIQDHALSPTFWRISHITAIPLDSRTIPGGAIVTMSLRLIDANGTERLYGNIADYWEYRSGEWYWSFRQWRLD